MNNPLLQAPVKDGLRIYLEHNISAILGWPSAIEAVWRTRSEYASSYDADIITVQLAMGQVLTLFAKNFGATRFPKDDPQQRRDRELRVYRDLLAETDLGTAKYYGSVHDESQAAFWCLLEFVHGAEVRHCDMAYWIAAAGWLGRLQSYFSQRSEHLHDCSFLIRHDADFFRSSADLALQNMLRIAPEMAHRLAPALDGYERIVEVLSRQPQTLVHGSYRPANILVDVNAEPMRLCPIDWEMAAIGSVFYDLAYLSEGFAPATLERFLEAYRQQAAVYGIPVPDSEESRYLLACFHFFMKIQLLSRARERNLSEKKITATVEQMEHLSHIVYASHANV